MCKMFRIFCLAVFVPLAAGQVIKVGVCNFGDIGGYVTNVNITGMLGTWNQVARINNEVGECSSLTLVGTYDSTGALTNVLVTHVEVLNKNKTSRAGEIRMSAAGVFTINIPDFLVGDFVVQAADYTNYAILYTCQQVTVGVNTKLVRAWQYHRKATLSESEEAALLQLADVNPDLNGTSWTYVSHNKTACGNGAMSLAVPHILIITATLFIGKELV